MSKLIWIVIGFSAVTAAGQLSRDDIKIDVPPAIMEYGPLVTTWCDQGCWDVPFKKDDPSNSKDNPPHRNKRLTCADKTRFLMTAEDGTKHCIAIRETKTGEVFPE